MDRLQAMLVFTRVVEAGSFARAADTLDLARASVTVIVKNLESHLNVRLLHRSTRRLGLTPEGAEFYERSVKILADMKELEDSVSMAGNTPRGRLRIDTPGAVGKILIIPALDDFRRRYPDIHLTIGFGDKPVNIIQEAVDCGIKLGALTDSNLVAKRIGTLQLVTVAAPRYLEQCGVPRSFDELQTHFGVRYPCPWVVRASDLQFQVIGKTVDVSLRSSVAVNDIEAYLACALKGLGIIQIPRFMSLPYLRSGELRELLPAYKPKSIAVSVVYPQNRHLSRTMRAFVDWISELFQRSPLLVDGPRQQTAPCEVMPSNHSTQESQLHKAPKARKNSAGSTPFRVVDTCGEETSLQPYGAA
ncbi:MULTISPECIES: LysR family transcriptional regulator [Paraburkholderia]|uniref:LysR family transcriptional regulator n=1 Tax=Paraburkholderia TaxID=1822464 RepID=UPI00225297F5|nr:MULTISPECIES: LysR family transcriptional regulator [Paraburkholderia]MCX4174572.1 LysR family transcriptional regulator [Paraburkholderia madseniana]MDQ6462573.1 LysR family transcriptional regulator [Paraburkholderia madseniana]